MSVSIYLFCLKWRLQIQYAQLTSFLGHLVPRAVDDIDHLFVVYGVSGIDDVPGAVDDDYHLLVICRGVWC